MNWTSLMNQIKEYLEDKGYTDKDYLAYVLSNRHGWTEHELFKTVEFYYENARFTLTQLCNIVELYTGNDLAFLDELRKRVLDLMEGEEIAA